MRTIRDEDDDVTIEDVTADKATDKALRVIIEDESYWVPQSVITADSEVYKVTDEPGRLVVRRWWAEKNGFAS